MVNIRKAVAGDASRLAEIFIFAKRGQYRPIFHDDKTPFGVMQVLPLALEYRDCPEKLEHMWVYDDEFVKGLVHLEGDWIEELYVDPFFQGQGIGAALMGFALEQGASKLWVLEKNDGAIGFYKRQGFHMTQERQLVEGTPEYVVKMER